MQAVIRRIEELHTHGAQRDEEQLEVVFSRRSRLVVEAPAGYGKTRTMVSRVAYLIASGQVPNPKRILALTFSVNAACKVRRDIAEQLPDLLSAKAMSPMQLRGRVFSTNYHGLCRRILDLYGYLLDPHLKHVNLLRCIDDSRPSDLAKLQAGLTSDDIDRIVKYNEAAKKAGEEVGTSRRENLDYLSRWSSFYLAKVKELFLPIGVIPFNAILLLTRQLFREHPMIRSFYRSYFPVVLIDEFQDTNVLQWTLLQDLIGRRNEIADCTCLAFFGDPLQRIYGFIGAIRNVMHIAKDEYNMHRIDLKTNHRFRDNEQQLRLDANIRRNAENPCCPSIDEPARIVIVRAADQDEEASRVCSLVQEELREEPSARLAVLMRIGATNNNTKKFPPALEALRSKGISYFYALYSDVDDEYVEFHDRCSDELRSLLSGPTGTFRAVCQSLLAVASDIYDNRSETYSSLLTLLDVFLNHVAREYRFLTTDEKAELVKDVLDSKALKQYLGHVKADVVLSTVHGAKGLEWDYVVLPDMERFSFPSYMALCRICPSAEACDPDFGEELGDAFEREFFQELSVFYVAVTRAKRATFFSYSDVGLNSQGSTRANNPSCFLKLPGLDGLIQ